MLLKINKEQKLKSRKNVYVFKAQYVKHVVVQILKEIKQRLGETVREYYNRFKDMLSQTPYIIDEKLLVQWYMSRLLQKIHGPLRMHKIQSSNEALQKAQHIETDEDWSSKSSPNDKKLREKF
jgi:hypothetical protein